MKTELERYKEALAGARHALGMIERNPQVLAHADYLTSVQKELDTILNPPPEMEEVEVVQYTVITPNGGCLGTYHTAEEANRVMGDSFQLVPLTGTFQRPKPQKVEKSVSVAAKVSGYASITGAGCVTVKDDSGKYTRIAFWDYPVCHGKSGTVTFTWQE